MQEVPEQLRTAAILQLTSGLVNWFIMSAVMYFGLGCTAAACTFWIGGAGGLCGLWGCLLIPVGIFEFIVGIMGLTNPKPAGGLMKVVAYPEMASLIFGGLPAAIVGVIVYGWLNNPDVVAYLASDDD